MKKIVFLFILNLLFFSSAKSATANCTGGSCIFENSFHYKYAKTYCPQVLTHEEVETNYNYFIISKTGEQCTVLENN